MQELEKQYHIHCAEGDVGRYVILPGDPGRCAKIAELFDDAHFVSQNREYTIYTGTALVQAAKALGKRTQVGVVQCKDAFYGQHSPERMPVSYELLNKWEAWKRLHVKASEMESAALFVVADALNCRCGSCFHVVWNQEREKAGLDQDMSEDTTSAVQVGVEALKRLIQADRAAQ